MKYEPPKKQIDIAKVEREMMQESIAIIMQLGYGLTITYNAKHYGSPWSVHITKIAENENQEPISAFFGGGSPETAVQLAYENVKSWENAPHEPPILPLERAFADTINRMCLENESNTPDFILGQACADTFVAIQTAIKARDKWYGVKLEPGQNRCYDYDSVEPMTLRLGAIIKIGKRLWRLTDYEGSFQGNDSWKFEYTEKDNQCVDNTRRFSASELKWLIGHGALVGQPAEGEGRVL